MDRTSGEAGPSAGDGARGPIALCLSGGGLRATFFHLGVIVSLREQGRLGDVREIYAVSGGSILAAHLLVNWSRYTGSDAEFEAAVDDLRAVADRDIRGRILRRWLLAMALLVPRLAGLGPSRLLRREYAMIFGRESLRHHARKHQSAPDVHLLSTIFNTGALCSFSAPDFAFESGDETRRIDGDIVPLPFALAASSAFPPLFPPIELTRDLLAATPDEFPYAMALTDGGVFDNLGYKKFLQVDATGASASALVVLSDGSGAFHPDIAKSYRGLIARNVRATTILMRRIAEETLHAALHATGKRVVHVSIASVARDRTFPKAIQGQVQAMRTDLNRFSPVEVGILMTHGYEVCRDAFGPVPADIARGLPPAIPLVARDDRALDRIAKRAARRPWGLLNPRDWATYAIAAIALALGAVVPLGAIRVMALRASNSSLTATSDRLAEQLKATLPPPESGPQPAPPAASIDRAAYKVWIQFAGFTRERVVDLAGGLAVQTWNVQGADRGGERLSAAAGLNEVRFGLPADEPAARLLANEVGTGLGRGRPTAVRRNAAIPSHSLEVWIGQ